MERSQRIFAQKVKMESKATGEIEEGKEGTFYEHTQRASS